MADKKAPQHWQVRIIVKRVKRKKGERPAGFDMAETAVTDNPAEVLKRLSEVACGAAVLLGRDG